MAFACPVLEPHPTVFDAYDLCFHHIIVLYMYNFVLDVADGFGHDVKVFVPDNVTERQLQSYNPFCNWKATLRQNLELQHTDENHTFHHDPYVLRSITVQSVDWFGGRIGFVKLSANVQNSRRGTLPGITMLRGGFVSVLMILRPRNTQDERYVLLATQPRLPAASLQFLEMPSGWISESGDFAGVSAREMEEEMNVKLNSSDLLNLSELAQQYSSVDESFLHKAIYPMAGGSDEFVVIFLWEKVSSNLGGCE